MLYIKSKQKYPPKPNNKKNENSPKNPKTFSSLLLRAAFVDGIKQHSLRLLRHRQTSCIFPFTLHLLHPPKQSPRACCCCLSVVARFLLLFGLAHCRRAPNGTGFSPILSVDRIDWFLIV